MEFTLGSMYWIDPRKTEDELREDMRQVVSDHLTFLRIFIQWEYVEPRLNQFDFTMFDRFFKVAEEFSSLRIMPTLLFYQPLHRLTAQLEQGIDERDRRYPCLDRPEVRNGLEPFFRAVISRYKDSPALSMWNVWNEPTDNECACPHSLAAFAAWLHRRYASIDELRGSWAGEYGIFNPLVPDSLEELDAVWLHRYLTNDPAKMKNLFGGARGRDTALRLDWHKFQLEHTVEHLKYLTDLVREADTRHPVQVNPCCTTSNPVSCGVDPWRIAALHNGIAGSVHPHGMLVPLEPDYRNFPRAMCFTIDEIRSWGAGREAWLGEYQGGSTCRYPNSYTPRKQDIAATLFHSLARGLRGAVFWQWQSWRSGGFETGEFSLRNPSDGGPTERSMAVREFGEFLEKYRTEIAGLQPVRPKVAVFQSFDQLALDMEYWRAPAPKSVELNHFRASFRCHQALVKAGIEVDFVNENEILSGALSKYRVLIAPKVQVCSKPVAECLTAFVRQGGALWADGRFAFLDTPFCLRRSVPGHGLVELFGAREADEVAPFPGDCIVLKNGEKLPASRELQRFTADAGTEVTAECNGYPVAVRRKTGKGVAEMWGTYFSANPDGGAALEKLLIPFALIHGGEPEIVLKENSGLVVSHASGKEADLFVFTNISREKQKVFLNLSGNFEPVNDFSGKLDGRRLVLELQQDETIPLFLKRKLQ